MKGLCSNQTGNILKWITHLLAVCCVILVLGSCTLFESKPVPPPEPPAKSDVPEPILPCSTLPARDLEREALELLDAGKALEARGKLTCALELSSGSRQASLLLEQLDADPVEYLGSQYFLHKVKSSETLSKIAKQYLGSSLKFVILARYNGIDVPANLVAGQDIKIPGTKPVADVPPEPDVAPETIVQDAITLRDQALEMEQQGRLDDAFELMTRALAEDQNLENTEDELARISKELVLQLEEEAYNQELSGDPEKAVEIWRRILSIDPGNIPAQLALKRLTE
jgi:tetratricopeptide (TPR) repeat protein